MPPIRTLVRFVCVIALSSPLFAQSGNLIHVRLLDGKTGLPVKADNYLVLVDHHDTQHNDWVKIGDDGTVTVTVPADAKEFSVKATYNMAMETYINCDADKENARGRDIWYPVSSILTTGVVAPNECSKTHYTAKPGEFVFFVRKRNWRDFSTE